MAVVNQSIIRSNESSLMCRLLEMLVRVSWLGSVLPPPLPLPLTLWLRFVCLLSAYISTENRNTYIEIYTYVYYTINCSWVSKHLVIRRGPNEEGARFIIVANGKI